MTIHTLQRLHPTGRLAMLFVLLILSACSTSTTKTGSTGSNHGSDNWFCQTGVDPEDWECVQDNLLADQPKPTRSPPKQPVLKPTPASAPVPAPVARAFAPETSATDVPEPRESSATPSTNSAPQTAAALPDYIRLAYRPAKAVSILDIPADFWAVQLVALSSKEALDEFVRAADIKGMSAARIAVDGDKLFYILLLGIYETLETAQEVSRDLPPPFENPWIRSVGSLQTGMLAAEKLTGSSEL